MEHTDSNPLKNTIAIIPARLNSTRLAGKMLLEIAGKPLIQHTYDRALGAETVARVIVATDSREIFEAVRANGGEAVMTSPGHQSGSDRVAEVAAGLPEDSIIINVQGDEPIISPHTIDAAVRALIEDAGAEIATTSEPFVDADDVLSPDVVKVVTDAAGYALYFSRSPIPFLREEVKKYGGLREALAAEPAILARFRKHTGLYVYRRNALLKFTSLAQTPLEQTEMLEQLRALENGFRIKVVEVRESSIGVDTQADLDRVRLVLEG